MPNITVTRCKSLVTVAFQDVGGGKLYLRLLIKQERKESCDSQRFKCALRLMTLLELDINPFARVAEKN